MQLDFTEDELALLRDAVVDKYEMADNDDDARALSELHVKLGGDVLFDDSDEGEDSEP